MTNKSISSTASKLLHSKNSVLYCTYAIWALSWAGIFGSLYFSEIRNFIPCELCWWQRLLLYPLAVLTTVAIARKEYKEIFYYILPFSVLGVVVSGYHSLLQWGIITKNVLDCSEGAAVSCSNPEILLFGFITIPFLAFLSFIAITVVASFAIFSYKRSV